MGLSSGLPSGQDLDKFARRTFTKWGIPTIGNHTSGAYKDGIWPHPMMLGREATGLKAKGGSPCCLWSRCAKLSPFLDDFFESHLSSSFRNWLLTWNVLNNQLCLTETCSEESLPHSENWRYNTRKFQDGCVLLRLYVNKAGYLCIYGMLIYVAQTLNGKNSTSTENKILKASSIMDFYSFVIIPFIF